METNTSNTYDNTRLKELREDLNRFQTFSVERKQIDARLKELATIQPELFQRVEKERADYEEAMIDAQKWYARSKTRERVEAEQFEMVEAEKQYRQCGEEYGELLQKAEQMDKELSRLKSIERTYRNQLLRAIDQNRWKDSELGRSIRELEEKREELRKRNETIAEVFRMSNSEMEMLRILAREIAQLLEVVLPRVYTSSTAVLEVREAYRRINEWIRIDYAHRNYNLAEMGKLPESDRELIPIDKLRRANELLFEIFVKTRYRKRIGTDTNDVKERTVLLMRAQEACMFIESTTLTLIKDLDAKAQVIAEARTRIDRIEESLLLA